MRKIFILSSVIIAAMISLTSCNGKKEPDAPQITKEQLIGDWHYHSGDMMSVPGLAGETIYHIDLTLSNSGSGTITGWYEADVDALTSKTADLQWTLENNTLNILNDGGQVSYALSFTDEGYLHMTHPDFRKTDFRRDMFKTLEAELTEKNWISPFECKGQDIITYVLEFYVDNNCSYSVTDHIKRTTTRYTSFLWELKDTTVLIWNTKEKNWKRFEWPVKFINSKFTGLDNITMQK